MSEPETPTPTAPELDVTQPVPPAEAPALPADPNIPGPEPTPEPVTEPEPVPPVTDESVLQGLLTEVRDLKQRIVTALGD